MTSGRRSRRSRLPSGSSDSRRPAAGQRAAAIGALVLAPAVLLLATYIVVVQFPRGLLVLGCVVVALAAGWYGLLRRGGARLLGIGIALVALAAPAALLIANGDHIAEAVLLPVGWLL